MILRFLLKNFQLDLFLFLHFFHQDKQLCVVEKKVTGELLAHTCLSCHKMTTACLQKSKADVQDSTNMWSKCPYIWK